mmetsp:Transcript_64581/g.166218  ORF Transcript_64581/g.166218 Transcript_64581/m.166218 type:complete len:142 (+) Transcript_64581:61-486(+)
MGRGRSASRSSRSSSGSRSRDSDRKKETGIINSWNVEKQFGFISCDGNRPDVFCHAEGCRDLDLRDSVKQKGFRRGEKVRFDVKEPEGKRKKCEAMNVELVDSKGGGGGGGGKRGRSDSRSRGRGRSQRRKDSRSRSRRRR